MEIKYKYVPEEMKTLKRFVGWRREDLEGKVAKLPFSLLDGQGSNWNKPDRWLTFEEAKNKNSPLGFVLVEEDKIVCIDLDRAITGGKLTPMAEEIIKDFSGSYMEISQSGQGIHIFAKGSLENNLNLSSKGIEIYKDNRYIALTGDVGEGKFFPISNKLLDKDLEIKRLYEKWTQEKPSTIKQLKEYRQKSTNHLYGIDNLSLDEILATMERTNDKASRLISGGSLTGDHSRDDFIFLVLARNYTGGDPDLMKDLFLMTPLNRLGSGQKRRDDRKYMDYLEKTIDKVLRLGSFKSFDWSNHLAYKERMKAYERF
jgi:primase-polymerase (primpol)-like protein